MKYYVVREDRWKREPESKGEDDRYAYFLSSKGGVTMTTPFKEKATVFTEDEINEGKVRVNGEFWECVKIAKPQHIA